MAAGRGARGTGVSRTAPPVSGALPPDALALYATADGSLRTAVFHLMTMPFTIRLLRSSADVLEAAALEARSMLAEVDRVFSPFRADSLTSAFNRQDPAGLLGHADFYEVFSLCSLAEEVTDGLFRARRGGAYDPVGLVKGWAVERVYERVLAPLLESGRAETAAVSGGGDLRAAAAAGSSFEWGVGIERPGEEALLATLSLADGAVATSGIGRRGAHIDYAPGSPRTPEDDVIQATVAADSLVWADVWATAAVSGGLARSLPLLSGDPEVRCALLVTRDGRVCRVVAGDVPCGDPSSGESCSVRVLRHPD